MNLTNPEERAFIWLSAAGKSWGQRTRASAGTPSTQFSSVQFYCSTPGLPVHHQLPEFTQTHVHHVSDTIQPSHPLSSPSPPAFNLSQHQGLFK